MRLNGAILLLILFCASVRSLACSCPLNTLGLKECDKYEIIFKGRITKVNECGDKPGSAFFEVQELFKGGIGDNFEVIFDCNVECSQKMSVAQEWIIYTNYKQVHNAKMDWCSRSRMYFKNDREDFYTVTYGNDYLDELRWLRKNLGPHRLLVQKNAQVEERNMIPDKTQVVITVLISIVVIVLFYWLFNRFFK